MYLLLLLLSSLACTPEPASIRFSEADTVVDTTQPIPLADAEVLDEKGRVISEPPPITWSAGPGDILQLEGTTVIPVENGSGTVTATIGDISAQYEIVVDVPTLADIVLAANSLSEVLSILKGSNTNLSDSENELDPGTFLLAFWAKEKLSLAAVDVKKDETSYKLVQKDPGRERGKRACVRGRIIQIERAMEGLYEGLMFDQSQNVYKFYAARDTGEIVQGSWTRFCGVVAGKHMYSNSGGGTTHAVTMVGVFDLPSNKSQ